MSFHGGGSYMEEIPSFQRYGPLAPAPVSCPLAQAWERASHARVMHYVMFRNVPVGWYRTYLLVRTGWSYSCVYPVTPCLPQRGCL